LNDVGANAPIKTLEDRKRQFAKQKALENKKKIFSISDENKDIKNFMKNIL